MTPGQTLALSQKCNLMGNVVALPLVVARSHLEKMVRFQGASVSSFQHTVFLGCLVEIMVSLY